MTEVTFAVLEVSPEPYAVTPVLTACIGIAADGDASVHAIALRCQVRIEPLRRGYTDEEAAGLLDQFGPRERWSTTQHNFLWLRSNTMVQGFTGTTTQVDLPLECTNDFEVTAALRDGKIPLQFLFSGAVFVKGANNFAVHQVPWDREDHYDLPVSVWRDLMQLHYPNTSWVRLDRETLDALAEYKSARGLLGYDDAVSSLVGSPDRGGAAMSTGWEHVRAVADAVLYEGYLLYPYRAHSSKNQSRWQFGVLGPQRAAELGIGEDATMSAQLLLDPGPEAAMTVVVRFLHLRRRTVERDLGDGGFEPVDELVAGSRSWLTWDEAVECELPFGPFNEAQLASPVTLPISVPANRDIEPVEGGRLVRTRRELNGELTLAADPDGGLLRISLAVRNTGAPAADKDDAIAVSLIGTHLITSVAYEEFVSLLEPPKSAFDAVARCERHRCFPVLAGPPGDRAAALVSPIILYDHPEIAEQSEGALYDSTEIDEILALRVMTMTDEEKAQARATDPKAAAIIDRCDSMSPEVMLNLHGVLGDPHGLTGPGSNLIPEIPDGVDWWDPLADNAVRPDLDAILVNGVRVSRGSRVRLLPSRRADAQDLFFADKVARVPSVHEDVDGAQHVGVVIEDDPPPTCTSGTAAICTSHPMRLNR